NVLFPFCTTYTFTPCVSLFCTSTVACAAVVGAVRTSTFRGPHAVSVAAPTSNAENTARMDRGIGISLVPWLGLLAIIHKQETAWHSSGMYRLEAGVAPGPGPGRHLAESLRAPRCCRTVRRRCAASHAANRDAASSAPRELLPRRVRTAPRC